MKLILKEKSLERKRDRIKDNLSFIKAGIFHLRILVQTFNLLTKMMSVYLRFSDQLDYHASTGETKRKARGMRPPYRLTFTGICSAIVNTQLQAYRLHITRNLFNNFKY